MNHTSSHTTLDTNSARQRLLRWYDGNARELPWRGATDPYAVWVSEIMCQQTRVDTVRAYYTRWLQRFPTVAALAAASEDDVMALWAGLGYYRRARSLHRAAAFVVAELEGRIPTTYAGLRELPGVGDYTAGAIASITCSEVVPAVDGNAVRVLSRLCLIDGDPTRAAFRNEVRAVAAALVDPGRPGDFNQALMELGALVCTPRSPSCDACPLQDLCAAHRADTIASYPPRAARSEPRVQTTEALVIGDGERVWVEKAEGDGLLGGTWVFPTFPEGALPEDFPAQYVGAFEHVFSHIRMTYRVHACDSAERAGERGQWVERRALPELGMSTAMRRVAETAAGGSPGE